MGNRSWWLFRYRGLFMDFRRRCFAKIDLCMRQGYLDALLVESLLYPLPYPTHHVPLPDGLCVPEYLDLYPRVPQLVHPEHLRCLYDDVLPVRLLGHLLAHAVYHRKGMVEISAIGYRDIQVYPPPFPGVVRGYPHLTVRHEVNHSIQVSQDSPPQVYLLHDAADVADLDNVADIVLVFDNYEQPADEVADEGLRPETDGYADDAESGDERPDVYPQFGEYHERGYNYDQYPA